MNKLEEVAKMYADIDAQVSKAGENLFREFFTEIFEAAPEIRAVHWRQYVPGFNDGEPCLFSLYEVDLLIDGLDKKPDSEWFSEASYDYMGKTDEVDTKAMSEDYPQFMNSSNWYSSSKEFELDWHWEKEKGRYSTPSGVPAHICEAVNRIHTTVTNNQQACQSVFGSNAEITITPEKIVVDDYDCGW